MNRYHYHCEGFGNLGSIICEALGSAFAGQLKAAVPHPTVCVTAILDSLYRSWYTYSLPMGASF